MGKLKRRDFMKIVGIAVACPTQILNAKPKWKHHSIVRDPNSQVLMQFGKGSMILDGKPPSFIMTILPPCFYDGQWHTFVYSESCGKGKVFIDGEPQLIKWHLPMDLSEWNGLMEEFHIREGDKWREESFRFKGNQMFTDSSLHTNLTAGDALRSSLPGCGYINQAGYCYRSPPRCPGCNIPLE